LKKLEKLSEIVHEYNTYVIDLWGVMHDGIKLNTKAIEAVENLEKKSKKIIFLSNAPRPSKNVIKFLKKLNMSEKLLSKVFTSGEAAMQALQENRFGNSFFHLGPQRDTSLFEGLEKNKVKINKCDFILCTGLFDEFKNLDYYKNLFKNNISKKLICTNPDLIVHRGNKTEFCAGKIAEIYSAMGGEVIYFGKPYTEIYNLFLKKNEKNLIIGDNLNTDIRGANNLKIDSLFITNGVHRTEFKKEEELNQLLKNYKVQSKYFQEELSW
jgi:HAD superfamily hydrolase (TIGR01459 family)|tara:strand:+ start:891 stop:1694 length:804 start_codon:yes stop_codon:yes gene_type:complete